MDLLFAVGAFSPSALVLGSTRITTSTVIFGGKFVDMETVGTLFVGVADGFDFGTATLQMVVVTFGSEELAVT